IAVTGLVEDTAGSGANQDFNNGLPPPNPTNFDTGTSYAAPAVAGAAGVLKDWLYDTGSAYLRNDPYAVRAMLLGGGDGAYPGAPNGTTVTVSPSGGFAERSPQFSD